MSAISRSPLACAEFGHNVPARPLGKDKHTNAKTEVDRSVYGVSLAYLKEAGGTKNMIIKPTALAAELVTIIDPTNKKAAGLMRVAKDAKNLSEATYLAGKFRDTKQRGVEAVNSPWAFGLFISKLTDLWVSITDVAKTVCREIMPLSARNATILDLSSSGATAVGMGLCILEDGAKRQEAAENAVKDKAGQECYAAKITNSYLATGRNVCYLALGILGSASVIAGLAVSQMVTWSFAVGALAFTLFGRFHEKMVVEKLAEQAGIKV